MILEIEQMLTAGQAAAMLDALAQADWVDGRVTAGYQSAEVKQNRQLPEHSVLARQLGSQVIEALAASLIFQTAALPAAIFPPLFNCYGPGEHFGTHVDNAFRTTRTGQRIRTDLSATLFLAPPETYDGGELLVDDGGSERAFKLAAGSMLLYPATTLHRVAPVTRGARVASFFWVQSLVRDAAQRGILFDIDIAIQSLRGRVGDDDPALIALVGAYHNLLRQWAMP